MSKKTDVKCEECKRTIFGANGKLKICFYCWNKDREFKPVKISFYEKWKEDHSNT